MLTEAQLERIRFLARRLAGIELLDRHRDILNRRGRRLGIPDSAGFDALLGSAEAGDPRATRQFVGLLTTKFTGFFRHPHHFQAAARQALDAVRRHGRARLWSAAAATGEEPYSLAMTLMETFESDTPPVTLLATDIDEQALEVGRVGEYGRLAIASLDAPRRDRFFTESAPGRWTAKPALRRLVLFRPLNLVDPVWPTEGPFDVIFCRNVLMYLHDDCRRSALERMAAGLSPDGLLLLDPAEHLGPARHRFVEGRDGVHRSAGPKPVRAVERRSADAITGKSTAIEAVHPRE